MTEMQSGLRSVRSPNWLPRPNSDHVAEVLVDEGDAFSKGRVVQYYPYQGFGWIEADNGLRIFFRIDELDLVGPKGHRQYVRDGARVGYDVAWTSNGLHTTKLKIY